ncbi:hypothetical protein IWGMT90018_60720 [Mycobacterium kiyosense]|nr:hypothetical protein IWGMT90018_60720 [Mycobacterium kiyosense]
MLCGDTDELRQPGLEALPVLSPQLVVQEHPHRVEPVEARSAQLAVDAGGIVGAGLKHLELIDRRRGRVVAPDEPTLRLIPVVGTVGRPPARVGAGARCTDQRRAHGQRQRQLEGGSTVHDATVVSVGDPSRAAYRTATSEVENRYAAVIR